WIVVEFPSSRFNAEIAHALDHLVRRCHRGGPICQSQRRCEDGGDYPRRAPARLKPIGANGPTWAEPLNLFETTDLEERCVPTDMHARCCPSLTGHRRV